MKRALSLMAVALLAGCATNTIKTAPPQGITYKVYFLGGQSNMEGFGYVADLPPELVGEQTAIPIYHGKTVEDGKPGGGAGLWQMLRPGHGTGFDTNGTSNSYSDRFGPELTFGTHMQALRPDERIAIIKFARGGTALVDGVSGYGSWDPDYTAGNGRNQYDNAQAAIRAALAQRDIDGDGLTDRLEPAGILWMQGEADAFDSATASEHYAKNLARLMALLRQELGNRDLPIVIAQIKDSGDSAETRVMAYSPRVQAEQARFADDDRCAVLIDDTKSFGFLPDGWHYRSENYITLGRSFANAIVRLERSC